MNTQPMLSVMLIQTLWQTQCPENTEQLKILDNQKNTTKGQFIIILDKCLESALLL